MRYDKYKDDHELAAELGIEYEELLNAHESGMDLDNLKKGLEQGHSFGALSVAHSTGDLEAFSKEPPPRSPSNLGRQL